jgi:pimeloyl-ACP methyl ester carboxylesterase
MTGKQIEDLKPKDAAGIEKAEGVLRPVLSHLLGPRNTNRPVKGELGPSRKVGEMSVYQWKWTVEADGRVVPLLGFSGPDKGVEEVEVLLTLPGGTAAALKADGTPIDLIAGLVNSGHGVTVPDLFTVYAPPPPPAGAKPAVEFFAGYNLSIPARRVQDLLVLLELRDHPKVDLIAVGDTAPVALLARALVPDRIDRTVIDGSALSAPPPIAETDANFLPHALRYGGLWPLASLGGTSPLLLHSLPEDNSPAWLTATFAAAGASDKLHIERAATVERIVEWLKR